MVRGHAGPGTGPGQHRRLPPSPRLALRETLAGGRGTQGRWPLSPRVTPLLPTLALGPPDQTPALSPSPLI